MIWCIRKRSIYFCLHLVVFVIPVYFTGQIQVEAEETSTSSYKKLASSEIYQKLKDRLAENSKRTASVKIQSRSYDSTFKVETWGEIELSCSEADKMHVCMKPPENSQFRNQFNIRKEKGSQDRQFAEQVSQDFVFASSGNSLEHPRQNVNLSDYQSYVRSMFLLTDYSKVKELYESNELYETDKGFIWVLIPKEVDLRWETLKSKERFAEEIHILIEKISLQPIRGKIINSQFVTLHFSVENYEIK